MYGLAISKLWRERVCVRVETECLNWKAGLISEPSILKLYMFLAYTLGDSLKFSLDY